MATAYAAKARQVAMEISETEDRHLVLHDLDAKRDAPVADGNTRSIDHPTLDLRITLTAERTVGVALQGSGQSQTSNGSIPRILEDGPNARTKS